MKSNSHYVILASFSILLLIAMNAFRIDHFAHHSKSNEKLIFKILTPADSGEVSGTIIPNGPPKSPPMRIEAGNDCIVDLIQNYTVNGPLSGTFDIDYRIIVHGPCTEPPGTYDEEWIAHGYFTGKINNLTSEGKFTYTAKVRENGSVNGKIVFGPGITGELDISGNFNEGQLSYKGIIN